MTLRFTTVLTFVMFAIFAVMCLISLGYPPGARFMPLLVGLPGAGLCLLQLWIDHRAARGSEGRTGSGATQAGAVEAASATQPGQTLRRELALWAWFLGLVAGVLLFGFWITVPLVIAGFLRVHAQRTWRVAVLAAAAGSGVLYLVFAVLLRVPLHEGFALAWAARTLGL